MEAGKRYAICSLNRIALCQVSAALLALAILSGQVAAEEPRWYDYRPAVVTLKGFLAVKYFYGPPGFGETPKIDDKIEAWLLFPSTPFNIRGSSDPDDGAEETGVSQIQLVVITSKGGKKLWKDLRRNLGREVLVTGKLYESPTAHYWTGIAMELEKVVLVPRGNDLD